MIEDSRFDIRYTDLKEEEALKSWLSDPSIQKWYPISDEKELEGFVRNWVGFCRFHCSLTATFDGEPCGIATLYLMPFRKVMHLGLAFIIVDPRYQRRGIGAALIKNLKHLGKEFFRLKSFHFEVYQGSPLCSLLEKQGFHQVVRQEDFARMDGKSYARIIYEVNL